MEFDPALFSYHVVVISCLLSVSGCVVLCVLKFEIIVPKYTKIEMIVLLKRKRRKRRRMESELV